MNFNVISPTVDAKGVFKKHCIIYVCKYFKKGIKAKMVIMSECLTYAFLKFKVALNRVK